MSEAFPGHVSRRWVEVIGILVVMLAIRGVWHDPARPYWSSASVLAVSLLAAALAMWTRRPIYVYLSGFLINLIGMLFWQAWLVDVVGIETWMAWGPGILDTFLYTNIICLAISSACWSLIETAVRARAPAVNLRGRFLPFNQLSALIALHLLAILIVGGVTSHFTSAGIELIGAWPFVALGATAVAIGICLWDADAVGWKSPALQLYIVGLLGIGLTLQQRAMPAREFALMATLTLAGYVLVTTVLAWAFGRVKMLRQVLRWPESRRAEGEDSTNPLGEWLLPAQGVLVCVILALSTWIALDFAGWMERLTGPVACTMLILASAVFLSLQAAEWKNRLRHIILAVGALTVVEVAWVSLDATLPAPWLHRNVAVMICLTVLSVLYVYGLAGRSSWRAEQPDWVTCGRQQGFVLGGLAMGLLVVVFVQEFALYDTAARHTPMALPAVILMALTLLAVTIGTLVVALVPRFDPFQLSVDKRAYYVYAAEVLLVLLLVHMRLNVPHVIPRIIGQYWSLVIMFSAFLGVGVSEWLSRRGVAVLAEPLRRTGIFLPVVPIVCFLVRPLGELRLTVGNKIPGLQPLLAYIAHLPDGYTLHATIWFLMGILYVFVAVTRRSSRFAFLAALAANFSLWVIFANHEFLSIWRHPQIWFMPLALIVLAAEHINRDRLGPRASTVLRYASLSLLYLSSTVDMFIAGLGNSALLPVVLAILSVLGALAGILLRVRAFLLLGITFLFLVVFSQIWYVAVDLYQTWVWWASGIVLGAGILTLFAIFEKRRNDVLRIVENLKKWD